MRTTKQATTSGVIHLPQVRGKAIQVSLIINIEERDTVYALEEYLEEDMAEKRR